MTSVSVSRANAHMKGSWENKEWTIWKRDDIFWNITEWSHDIQVRTK